MLRPSARWCLAPLLLAAGCISPNSVQLANTLGRGRVQVGLEPGVVGAASSGGGLLQPRLDVSGRYGLTDSVDVGVRLGGSGAELQSKFLLSEPGATGTHVSVAPLVGGIPLVVDTGSGNHLSGSILNFQLPLLIGFDTVGGSQLVLGPRLADICVIGDSSGHAALNLLLVGTSVGYSYKLSRLWRVHPEVGVLLPLLGEAAVAGNSSVRLVTRGVLLQVSLGLMFGG